MKLKEANHTGFHHPNVENESQFVIVLDRELIFIDAIRIIEM